jgi:aspartate aminotransferase
VTGVRLSRRVAGLAPSSTVAVAKAAKALAASGVDVVDLGIGEPDFQTPAFVGQAGIDAIGRGATKYTDVAGNPSLRDAIAERYRRNGAEIRRENVIVTAGAKQAVFNVCQALFQEGDEVAIFSPYWVSFPEMVRLSGAEPLFVPTTLESGWRMRAAALEEAATPPTRGVIVNSPNNPTGAVVEAEELEEIVRWCAAHDAVLIFDETYDHFVYGGARHVSAASFWGRYPEHVVITGAASKTYAMTGWRLGWAVGPTRLVSAMSSYQSHSTSNASSISQEAACVALSELARSEESVARMLEQYVRRRESIVGGLHEIEGVECAPPQGAFYVFPRVSALFGRKGVSGSVEFCDRLLREAHVAGVPGEAFGEDSCVRFSFATGVDRIQEAIRRLAGWAK